MSETFANERVLDFYRELAFNAVESPDSMAAQIAAHDATDEYPPLRSLLGPGVNVLDAGCGTGWLTNSVAYHTRAFVTGIDFNPLATEFAAATARALKMTNARFEHADLFTYAPRRPFDVVLSLGVLHHTNDCCAAVRRLFALVKPGGHAFIGLYHAFGRRPFLDHFRTMAKQGASEKEQLDAFAALFGQQGIDEKHVVSWFRDQVLHPHETQHSLREMLPVIESSGAELLATSINGFAPIASIDDVLDRETQLETTGRQRLSEGVYYPGFFTFLARSRA